MPSARKLIGQATRPGRGIASFALGKVSALVNRSRGPKADMTDQTLKSKVETELFRGADVPKGDIDVVVVDRVVELRGQVKRPEMKKDLEAKAKKIPEVREVKNLLHLPKTPAPTRADSPGRARRKASTGTGEGPRRTERFTTEKPVEDAEATPAEREHAGRGAAPLGSQEPES